MNRRVRGGSSFRCGVWPAMRRARRIEAPSQIHYQVVNIFRRAASAVDA